MHVAPHIELVLIGISVGNNWPLVSSESVFMSLHDFLQNQGLLVINYWFDHIIVYRFIATAMNGYQELLGSYLAQNNELQVWGPYWFADSAAQLNTWEWPDSPYESLPLYQFACVSFAVRVGCVPAERVGQG